MTNREVLTAIAAGQVMIRSPVMESGGLFALLRSTAAGESCESGGEWGEGAVRGGKAGASENNATSREWPRACSHRRPRAPLGPGSGEIIDLSVPREPGPGVL